MDGQQKLFAVFWVCCTVAVASVAGAVAWYNVRAIEEFTRNGYSEATAPGHDSVWVRSRQPVELIPPPPPAPAPWPPEAETIIHVPVPPPPADEAQAEKGI